MHVTRINDFRVYCTECGLVKMKYKNIISQDEKFEYF